MSANRIRALRKDRGLTLDQLVDRVAATGGRIDKTLLSRLELGQRPLTPDRVSAIAAALDASPDEIV